MLDVRCWMFDVGCSMLDVRCWMPARDLSAFDVRCSMFQFKPFPAVTEFLSYQRSVAKPRLLCLLCQCETSDCTVDFDIGRAVAASARAAGARRPIHHHLQPDAAGGYIGQLRSAAPGTGPIRPVAGRPAKIPENLPGLEPENCQLPLEVS